MAALRRQQLSDIAAAYGLAVNLDAPKEDLLLAVEAAEQAGTFRQAPKDPHRLVKASKTPDEWKDWRDSGQAIPPFEDPEKEMLDAGSFRGLQQRCKAAGIDSFGKSAEQMRAALEAAAPR